MLSPRRPKARGLAQHNGPPGWLEEVDPASVIFYVYRLSFPYHTGCPDKNCPAARADRSSSCCYIIMSRKEGMSWNFSRLVPSLWAVPPAFSVPYRLPWLEVSSCEMEFPVAVIMNVQCTHYTTIRHELHYARKAWPRTLVEPCFLSG
jgi:hypothetical protein